MVLDKGIWYPKPRVANIKGTNLKSLIDPGPQTPNVWMLENGCCRGAGWAGIPERVEALIRSLGSLGGLGGLRGLGHLGG